MTFGMNVSRFMNLSAIFSLDLESQYNQPLGLFIEEWMEINRSNNIMDTNILFIFFIFQYCSRIFPNILCSKIPSMVSDRPDFWCQQRKVVSTFLFRSTIVSN